MELMWLLGDATHEKCKQRQGVPNTKTSCPAEQICQVLQAAKVHCREILAFEMQCLTGQSFHALCPEMLPRLPCNLNADVASNHIS